MILILSQNDDSATDKVISWLHHIGHPFIRVNGDGINTSEYLNIDINELSSYRFSKNSDFCLKLNAAGAVWFRRSGKITYPKYEEIKIKDVKKQLINFYISESKHAREAFYTSLSDKYWLNFHENTFTQKIKLLLAAINNGLNVPHTIISNKKSELYSFSKQHGKIIIKPISDPTYFVFNKVSYNTLTQSYTINDIASFPDTFFPLLAQEQIDKEYEIRIFYIEGIFYSIAIFSQTNKSTSVDFRNYDYQNCNRMVPVTIPKTLKEKIKSLMAGCNINSGSIDLIKATNGKYIFLEVNPVGQFGFVSQAGNYNLEKKIANLLIKKDKNAKRTKQSIQ